MRRAHDASGAPLNFPDRVWFPGEWEEVKAIYIHNGVKRVISGRLPM